MAAMATKLLLFVLSMSADASRIKMRLELDSSEGSLAPFCCCRDADRCDRDEHGEKGPERLRANEVRNDTVTDKLLCCKWSNAECAPPAVVRDEQKCAPSPYRLLLESTIQKEVQTDEDNQKEYGFTADCATQVWEFIQNMYKILGQSKKFLHNMHIQALHTAHAVELIAYHLFVEGGPFPANTPGARLFEHDQDAKLLWNAVNQSQRKVWKKDLNAGELSRGEDTLFATILGNDQLRACKNSGPIATFWEAVSTSYASLKRDSKLFCLVGKSSMKELERTMFWRGEIPALALYPAENDIEVISLGGIECNPLMKALKDKVEKRISEDKKAIALWEQRAQTEIPKKLSFACKMGKEGLAQEYIPPLWQNNKGYGRFSVEDLQHQGYEYAHEFFSFGFTVANIRNHGVNVSVKEYLNKLASEQAIGKYEWSRQATSENIDIAMPSDVFKLRDDTHLFGVDVTPGNGGPAWRIFRRYSDFKKLRDRILNEEKKDGIIAEIAFPGSRGLSKKWFSADGGLEKRRSKLEKWLKVVVQRPESKGAWESVLRNFLEQGGEFLAGPKEKFQFVQAKEWAMDNGMPKAISKTTVRQFLHEWYDLLQESTPANSTYREKTPIDVNETITVSVRRGSQFKNEQTTLLQVALESCFLDPISFDDETTISLITPVVIKLLQHGADANKSADARFPMDSTMTYSSAGSIQKVSPLLFLAGLSRRYCWRHENYIVNREFKGGLVGRAHGNLTFEYDDRKCQVVQVLWALLETKGDKSEMLFGTTAKSYFLQSHVKEFGRALLKTTALAAGWLGAVTATGGVMSVAIGLEIAIASKIGAAAAMLLFR